MCEGVILVVIVYSGKGGTGKTTLSALSLKYFMEKGEVTLALDLDPDAHLHKLLRYADEEYSWRNG